MHFKSKLLEINKIFFNFKFSVNKVRGSFFMFIESGCISTNIEFTVP